jgi:hypothetical protein
MNRNGHPAEKLQDHVKKYGPKGLLPQNLTDELLDRMNLEGDAIEEDKTEETPSSTLLMAILYFKHGSKKISNRMNIEIEPELLMDHMSLYLTALRIEDMRCKKDIGIPDESLPTLKNIFDKNRAVPIRWLR